MTFLSLLALAAALALAALAATAALTRERRRARLREVELRDALRRSSDAARAADFRDAFFDMVSHELRSPLSAILGFQELLQDGAYGDIDDEAADAVERIGRSALHLLHLIDGVVLLSRLRTGDVPVQRAPVHLGGLLAPVADAFRTQASERGVEALVRMPDRLPTVLSDSDHLVRALDLLVTSVVKHPAGSTLELDVEPHDDGATLHIRGTAIDMAQHADPELRTGLRLAIAARVATLLDGELALSPPYGPVVESLAFRIRGALPPSDGAFDAVSRRG